MKSVAVILASLVLAALVGFGQSTDQDYRQMLTENPKSSLAHYGIGDIYFQQRQYQAATNQFRAALSGDLQPKWTEVWSHVALGKIFDTTGQRDRAVDQYKLAIQTNDNTRGALDEARRFLGTAYKP